VPSGVTLKSMLGPAAPASANARLISRSSSCAVPCSAADGTGSEAALRTSVVPAEGGGAGASESGSDGRAGDTLLKLGSNGSRSSDASLLVAELPPRSSAAPVPAAPGRSPGRSLAGATGPSFAALSIGGGGNSFSPERCELPNSLSFGPERGVPSCSPRCETTRSVRRIGLK
jgi:hypothetical protein